MARGDVSVFIIYPISSLTPEILPVKKQRVMDCVKMLLDVAAESADWFPPLKSALGGVNALIKHYEVLVGSGDICAQLTPPLTAIRRCKGKGRGAYPTAG